MTNKHLNYYSLIREGFGNLKFAQHDGISEILPGMSLVIHRDGDHQTQLIMLRPNTRLIDHAHPDVESTEIYLVGGMVLTIDGVDVPHMKNSAADPTTGCCILSGATVYLPAGRVHGGYTGPLGGAFLSVQTWLNGRSPSPIHLNWVGQDGSKNG